MEKNYNSIVEAGDEKYYCNEIKGDWKKDEFVTLYGKYKDGNDWCIEVRATSITSVKSDVNKD